MGARPWSDTRVTQAMSTRGSIHPIRCAGNAFYGDYQGLFADDRCAMPFWRTRISPTSPFTDTNYSPYQEVFSARYRTATLLPRWRRRLP